MLSAGFCSVAISHCIRHVASLEPGSWITDISAETEPHSFPNPVWHRTMNLTQTKIGTRLALGFGALAALMALLSGAAVYHLQAIDHHFENVMEDRYPKVQIASEIKAVNRTTSGPSTTSSPAAGSAPTPTSRSSRRRSPVPKARKPWRN
jgi:Four helix bundle sensory module for signal transduction